MQKNEYFNVFLNYLVRLEGSSEVEKKVEKKEPLDEDPGVQED
jgi:hypothetical protein